MATVKKIEQSIATLIMVIIYLSIFLGGSIVGVAPNPPWHLALFNVESTAEDLHGVQVFMVRSTTLVDMFVMCN